MGTGQLWGRTKPESASHREVADGTTWEGNALVRKGGVAPVVACCQGTVKRLYFRGDAAFVNPEICEFLEGESIGYWIRLPANRVLQDRIGYLLKRPIGRPSHEVRR